MIDVVKILETILSDTKMMSEKRLGKYGEQYTFGEQYHVVKYAEHTIR